VVLYIIYIVWEVYPRYPKSNMKIDLFLYSNWEIRTEDVSLAHRTVRCHSCISCGSAYFSHLCEQNWSKDRQQSSINASPWLERPVSIAKYSMYGLPSANVLVSIVWNKGPGACSSWSPLIGRARRILSNKEGAGILHLHGNLWLREYYSYVTVDVAVSRWLASDDQ